ncbi:MAG: putative glycoside hydrolase [Candidatus Dormibacteria bacterium]
MSAITALIATAPIVTASGLPGSRAQIAQSTRQLDASTSSSSSPVLLYAQDWNGASNGRSTSAWQQVAQTHSILVGSSGSVYGNMIPQLHGWNPAVKVLVYDLGPYTIKGSAEFTTLMAAHPDYFARDVSGNLITMGASSGSGAFPNNYLMDEANPGWQAEEASRILTNIDKYGYDGAYIDSMGPSPLTGGDTGVPVDPSTGHAFTATSWMQASGHALSVMKAAIGSKFLLSSGLVNGSEFTSYTHYLSDSTANGAQTDSWLRLAGSSAAQYPAVSTLASDLAMVQTLNAEGKAFFGWTKLWTAATPAQASAWNTYALAAYLLVDNGVSDYYSFSMPSSNADRTTIYFPNELAALGAPLGSYSLTNGVYSRAFQNGAVSLNTNTNGASIVWAVKPTVAAVTPSAGPVTGGQVVTVTGSGFAAGMSATLNGTAVTPSNVTANSFTLTTPAASAGYTQVQVTTTLGVSPLTSATGYIYAPLGNYVPLQPFRILDTRATSCAQCSGGALTAGATRTVQITGLSGLPSGSDPVPSTATALVLNVTAVSGSASSLLTIYPNGTGRPTASNLNFAAGNVTANLVTTVLGQSGTSDANREVNVYNAMGTVNVVADVEGYFAAGASTDPTGEFHPMAPVRVCDTRSSAATNPCRGRELVGGIPMAVNITSSGSDAIPGTNAAAAVLNVTGVAGSVGTYVSVYPTLPDGTCALPTVSSLNLKVEQIQANRVMVALGPAAAGGSDTSVCVFSAVGVINVLLDASGWYGTPGAATGDQYQAIGPSRVCDTRVGSGQPCAGHAIGAAPYVVSVASVGGVPAVGAAQPALAVIANLTAILPTAPTYLTVYPANLVTHPLASDINVNPGEVLANLSSVELDSAGDMAGFNAAGRVNVVIDVEGWFQ